MSKINKAFEKLTRQEQKDVLGYIDDNMDDTGKAEYLNFVLELLDKKQRILSYEYLAKYYPAELKLSIEWNGLSEEEEDQ